MKITEDDYDRAREFIDDVLRINTEHGMRSVESPIVYEAAVTDTARQAATLRQYAKSK